jgi:glycine/D-amino acid oxidase-like deaminating enzyme
MTDYANLSLWHASLPASEWTPRRALAGDTSVDVAIVGGGYTGLWTAYYLRRADPTLRIAIVEAQVVGFGASGRNGGWCSALLPMTLDAMSARHGRDAAVRLQRAMNDTVAEVGAVAAAENIDCHFSHGGTLNIARSAVQAERIKADVSHDHSYGFTDDDVRWLDRDEAAQRVDISRCHGAAYTPHCAAIHPARLVRGLARTVEAQGTKIYEQTRVSEISPRSVRTDHGTITADVVVRATEAFTPAIKGLRRTVAPIYSLMIATEPISDEVFDSIGLRQRETFNDGRRMIIYGQRTADNRFAFGGRGAPYHFASSMRPEYDRNKQVHDLLAVTLRQLFPQVRDVGIAYRWGGAVAAARDWWCSTGFDKATGMAWAGGYVGDGVGTTNLAGRTLADLITGAQSDLVSMPWVGHRSRGWEPEPLRWIGINTMTKLPISADAYEERTGKAERWRSAILARVTGH